MSFLKPDTADLLKPYRLGSLILHNRIVMAPLTRSRAGRGDVQGLMHAEYYAQRASAGLIISEATQISPQGKGYAYTPGIYSEEQVEGWKLVTNAVHRKGGHIFAQLWHVGRISHPDLQIDQQPPVAPSAIRPKGQAFTERGLKDFITPRALKMEEIADIIYQYQHAARCARDAGFDGIELHAANGYLIPQFLCDKTNRRIDGYGGSIEHRSRLLLEVLDGLIAIWPANRVGVRLSPFSHLNDIEDTNPMALYSHVVKKLNEFGLAYLHCVEGETIGPKDRSNQFKYKLLRQLFNGCYIANNGYDLTDAVDARYEDRADLVCFGRPFIANPDLVERFAQGYSLAPEAPRETWYGGNEKGYTDWPSASEA